MSVAAHASRPTSNRAVNYFNYYTEIEEHFQRRRGSLLLLSTLDWALIDAWREAGIPLQAVLRGIDAAFDKRDAQPRRGRARNVNGLAWCAQAVVEQAQALQEAAVGAAPAKEKRDDGFSRERIAAHLEACAKAYSAQAGTGFAEFAARMRALEATVAQPDFRTEELELALTMLEEKIFAFLVTNTPDDELVSVREQAARQLAPYRRKMQAAQIAQVERQFLHKYLLEARRLPRLSLFYMAQS
jgi:hypothetical protein